jgi:hypothetical protein
MYWEDTIWNVEEHRQRQRLQQDEDKVLINITTYCKAKELRQFKRECPEKFDRLLNKRIVCWQFSIVLLKLLVTSIISNVGATTIRVDGLHCL